MRVSIAITFLLCLGVMNLTAGEPGAESPAVTGMPSTEGASVSFRTLKDGDIVPTTFTVKFLISGMGIAPAGSDIENTGHHHLLIDVDELPAMDQPLPKSDNLRHFGGGQSDTELTLAEGEHTLQLLFADYVHRPHDPPVISEKITITVSSEAVPLAEPEKTQP